jgi:hypothetical protein
MLGFGCRGGGIRTPGTSRYNGFQDRRIRPLCHSSIEKRHCPNSDGKSNLIQELPKKN